MSNNRDAKKRINNLLKAVEAKGCTTECRNSGHIAIRTPGGATVYMASTPRDVHGIERTKSILRRNGVDIYGETL